MPRPRHRAITLIVAVLALSACAAGPDASPSSPLPTSGAPAATTDATATAIATASATTDATASADASPFSPSPTDEGPGGEPFTCDLPIVDPGSAPIANIVDVRVGTHDGYDRLVFEFEQGTPELTLDRATPPFTEDGSGRPIEVEGDSFLGLVMRGGTKQTDDGTSSYDGPTEFETGFPTLLHAVQGGDFERQSTWYLGLGEEACTRLLVLDDPPRVVIDVER